MNQPDYYKRERIRCGAVGVCIACRKQPREAGLTKCRDCNAHMRAYMRDLRASRGPGRCTDCRRQSVPGLTACIVCRESGKRREARRRRSRVAALRCMRCGLRVSGASGIKTCVRCGERGSFTAKIRRALRHG